MKEALTKVIDTLTQEDLYGAFQKLLERYKCIAAGGDYFEGDYSFMCVLSIKVPIRKKAGNLFHDPHIYKIYAIKKQNLSKVKTEKGLFIKSKKIKGNLKQKLCPLHFVQI